MIFFFEKFGYAWGTHAEVPQEYKYPKSIRYGYGSIFGVPVLHRYYEALRGSRGTSFPWQSIWEAIVLRKVALFTWTATLGRILTIDILHKL